MISKDFTSSQMFNLGGLRWPIYKDGIGMWYCWSVRGNAFYIFKYAGNFLTRKNTILNKQMPESWCLSFEFDYDADLVSMCLGGMKFEPGIQLGYSV